MTWEGRREGGKKFSLGCGEDIAEKTLQANLVAGFLVFGLVVKPRYAPSEVKFELLS